MTPADNSPIVTPQAQRIANFKQRSLPVIVWSVCAVLCVVLLTNRARSYQYIGLAQAPQYEVSATATGTIDSLVVSLFQDVQAGEVVATLDERPVLATIETANATIGKLQADLEAAKAQMLSGSGSGLADVNADLRRFQIDEEDRRLAALSLRVVIESDEVERGRLWLDVERNRQLLEDGIIGQAFFDMVKAAHDVVDTRLTKNKILLSQTEEEYRVARERREEYEADLAVIPAAAPQLRPLQEAITIEAARLREIQVQRASLVLRSPVDGRVSSVFGRQGQAVIPGEPVVMISERTVNEIVAYLAEADGLRVQEQQPVRLVSHTRPGVVSDSVVLRVSPGIEILPQRLWRNPQVADYGRAVVIAPQPAMRLTPGETIEVRFRSR
ncbi:MAG: HlyD family efflux transporter periplasmic adaptor subunit [Acidobacteria bacterium]|nr:HlyD family efflux transporter periplasmic adaptor subunit [Acidobacteriota bacterium]NIM61998.1 HlyD family efflux transporter periplasmic adaptor subunit [Acidobacteriota bacterium]NIO58956.1 HlyD family efflux transporter periplasmic adaptor subunit [Acidobacteriota bacterium]NIQ30002.1 HlyD family efflux transporter periplasmic adaptor subunit [Acidobacteriota bacterium]NIQ84081.1 HlyD family efflux transporter periplasmic adaptor subunit [Acidobacteriota bacterium]